MSLTISHASPRLSATLTLPDQGITVITGPSGAGKSSLVRLIAGFDQAPSTRINWRQGRWTEATPTWQRRVGMVFQEPFLFPHLNVLENLCFAEPVSRRAQTRRSRWIETLELESLLAQKPATLSGGERQRVALARALIADPECLLLDEPFSAIDETRRKKFIAALQALRAEGLPMIYVTHRLDDIAALGDYLVVMESGRVVIEGPPGEVLSTPHTLASLDEARGVLIDSRIESLDAPWHLAEARFAGGALWVRQSGLTLGQSVRLHIAARDVSLSLDRPLSSSIQNILPVTLLDLTPFEDPARVFVRLKAGASLLTADITARAAHQLSLHRGQALYAQIKAVALIR